MIYPSIVWSERNGVDQVNEGREEGRRLAPVQAIFAGMLSPFQPNVS
jgi:hypothetical protein